jgi:hypothetical protein
MLNEEIQLFQSTPLINAICCMLVAKSHIGQGCPTSGMGAEKSILPFPKIRVNNWPKKKLLKKSANFGM